MNRKNGWWILTVGLLLVVMSAAQAGTVADWPGTDYVPNDQGANNWWYLYTYGGYDAGESYQIGGGTDGYGGYDMYYSPYYMYVDNGRVLPGTDELWACLRWVSEVSADLKLTGYFQKQWATEWYGVALYIRVNGEEVMNPILVSNSDTSVHDFDITVKNVHIGDDVDFLIRGIEKNWASECFFGVTIDTAVTMIPGDANLDGMVDVGDLGILAGNYGLASGAAWGQGDFNGDGAVDVGDLGILAGNYGFGTVAGANVPEPVGMFLLGISGLFMIWRRR